jgi:cyanophycin synthetase
MNPDCLVPERYIDSVEQLFKVFRTQVDIVLEKRGTAVLNAEDDQLVEMASLCKGEVMYFSADAQAPVLAEHAERGGRAVVLAEGVISLKEGTREIAQLRAGTLELPIEGDSLTADDGLLAAVAAAWANGLSAELIQAGLETLEPMPANRVAA